ncbi:ATP-binding protein [Pseudoalteromonas ruthenica]|uniref:ATP-binding protein n=1 Tax=Pseudoalteromonas ruthenica TaxID=151081 RepID=UPI00110A6B94|nr:ATP-binding protein [Pseudoalteromonas ruthenica]TMO88113.1 hypothetical protein CWC12_07930 [Pseudoalteromonas ruthenica]TMP24050.1 hypothetical protein CWC06_07100 [Pseudoalteromonas ruthenica]
MSRDDIKSVFSVDVSPEMQIYKILQHLNYDLETAYAEFIDNSIQSFLDNKELINSNGGESNSKLNIVVEISSSNKQIVIKDNAGGISRNDMDRALKLGVDIGSVHSHKSLSVYGIGMKSSAIWFTDDWSIRTSSIGSGERLSFDFNLNDFLAENKTRGDVVSSPVDESNHFTEIVLRNHLRDETAEHYRDCVIPFIHETFVKFKDFVSIEFYYDGTRLAPSAKKVSLDIPKIMEYPPIDKKGEISKNCIVNWKIPLDFEYEGRSVGGFIMLRGTGSYGQPGLRLLRNNRVIEGTSVYPNIPEPLLRTKNKYAAQRIYGELNLDSFPVDFMKTNFNENLKGLYTKLREMLTTEYNVDILFQAEYFRKKVADKPENLKIVKDLIKQGSYVEIGEKGATLQEKDREATPEPKVEPSEQKSTPSSGLEPQNTGNAPSDTNTGNTAVKDDNGTSEPSGSQRYEPLPDNRIEFSENFHNALGKLTGNKQEHLYDSLCTVSLKKHSVLCYVGAWSFLEMFTALIGRNSNVSFPDFLGTKINEYTNDKNKRSELKRVVNDISTRGNCTKHSGIYWNHTAMDLKPSFIILEPFLTHLIELSIKKAEQASGS